MSQRILNENFSDSDIFLNILELCYHLKTDLAANRCLKKTPSKLHSRQQGGLLVAGCSILSSHQESRKVYIEDKSFLHKNHKSNENGKFHIVLSIESNELKKKNKLYSTRFIYKILDNELKNYIHSLQIKLI